MDNKALGNRLARLSALSFPLAGEKWYGMVSGVCYVTLIKCIRSQDQRTFSGNEKNIRELHPRCVCSNFLFNGLGTFDRGFSKCSRSWFMNNKECFSFACNFQLYVFLLANPASIFTPQICTSKIFLKDKCKKSIPFSPCYFTSDFSPFSAQCISFVAFIPAGCCLAVVVLFASLFI